MIIQPITKTEIPRRVQTAHGFARVPMQNNKTMSSATMLMAMSKVRWK
jgi:hypothetical protein